MGNPFISQALVRERSRTLERQAANQRLASAQVTAHLSAVRLFATCGKKELRAIAKTAKIAKVHSGTQIITEGDDGNTMYVILVGTARVSRSGRKLATVGPGRPRSASSRCSARDRAPPASSRSPTWKSRSSPAVS